MKPRVGAAVVRGDSAEPCDGLGDTVRPLGIPKRVLLVSTVSGGGIARLASDDDCRLCSDVGRLVMLLCTTGDLCCTKISGAPSLLGRAGGTLPPIEPFRGDESTRCANSGNTWPFSVVTTRLYMFFVPELPLR